MLNLTADIDKVTRELQRDLTTIQREVLPKALAATYPKVAAKIRTQGVREVSKAAKVKAKLVRPRFKGYFRKEQGGYKVRVFGTPVPAIILGPPGKAPRQTRKGVRVGSHTFPDAFVSTMKSGHVGVFARKTNKRLPINEQRVELWPHVKATMPGVVARVFPAEFPKELESQVYRFSKQKVRRFR